jgi:MurNAc alpha-1-phosphate uridylyltransferase
MLLAAGRGERLRPLTDRLPKPLARVGGEPLLAHQLRWLAGAGVTEVVINVHHLGQMSIDAFGDGAAFGLQIRYSREAMLLETGGGVVNALPLLGAAPFLLMNADIYTEFPLTELPPGPPPGGAHLVVTPRPAFRRNGDFAVTGGRISARGDDYVYCGIALIDPAALAARRATAQRRLRSGREVAPFSLRDV